MLKETLKKIIRALQFNWDNFWFTPISTSSLAVFRICFGLLLIQFALLLIPDLFVWFGKHGIVSTDTINSWQPYVRLNILNLFPESDLWLIIVFSVFTVASVFFTVGWLTRASTVVVCICLLSLHARNYLIINSGDNFMRALCFWLIFAPAGASLSVDHWLKKRKAKNIDTGAQTEDDDVQREHSGQNAYELRGLGLPLKPTEPCGAQRGNARRGEGTEAEAASIIKSSPWAQRLMQINMALLYAQAFSKKIIGDTWLNGTAVYFSSRMVEMRHLPIYYVFDHLWTCKLLTWATIATELSLFTLIWIKPLRYYVLILGTIMHLTIDWTMNIPQFEWLMISTYILFVDPADMDKFLETIKKSVKKFQFGRTVL